MKLLVIVLCLLSERFFVHAISYKRFDWFAAYCEFFKAKQVNVAALRNPWVMLLVLEFPLVLLVFLVYFLVGGFLFGLGGFIVNLAVFYYALGPGNPFYPLQNDPQSETAQDEVASYLAEANGQLFAVIFWYVLLGPVFLLIYRLTALSQEIEPVQEVATRLTRILDWIPARLTGFLYLLVGNFQVARKRFVEFLTSGFESNLTGLGACGVQAVQHDQHESVQMAQAELLVEHALLVFLGFLALFILISWL